MSDLYQKVANSPWGKSVVNALNLPAPVILERQGRADSPFLEGQALVGAAQGGSLLEAACTVIAGSPATVFYTSQPASLSASKVAATSARASEVDLANLEETRRFKAMVFDASGINDARELRALYDFFHPVARKVAKSGRILILGRPPEKCDPAKATAQKALEGFTRSLAKEVGKAGAIANLVYVEEGAESLIDGALRFLLSPKAAYVDGQVLTINKAAKPKGRIDWNRPLSGQTALVTGASRGIGAAIARVLARDGAKVIALDVPGARESLEQVAQEIGGVPLLVDITEDTSPQQIADFLRKESGGVDVVIHNAGVTRDKTLARMPEHFWDLLMEINLVAVQRINEKLLAENLVRKQGRLVGIASIGGIAGNFGQTNYGASKAGVIGYTEAMQRVLKDGITVNAIAPGFIETQMTAAMPMTIREAGRRMNSLSQGGQPQDVAEAVAFMASPGAAGISGQTLRVCGQSLIGK